MDNPTPEEILEWVKGQIWSKELWLSKHAQTWPSFDVDRKKLGVVMLKRIEHHYSVWIEHKKKHAAE